MEGGCSQDFEADRRLDIQASIREIELVGLLELSEEREDLTKQE